MAYFRQNLSKEVFEMKYQIRGERSPEEVFQRVAEEIAEAEKTPELREYWREKFTKSITKGEFIPAGRPLANARVDSPMKQYNNCFVVELNDDMGSITEAIGEYMTILKKSGGCVVKNSNVLVKDKGFKKIQDVVEGDLVYCFNPDTQVREYKKVLQTHTPIVEKERQIEIQLRDNTTLITSTEHPTLVYRDGRFIYVKAKDVSEGDLFLTFDKEDLMTADIQDSTFGDEDLAWFVGAHLGDGSTDLKKVGKTYKNDYKGMGVERNQCRIRIIKDNKEMVSKYAKVYNTYTKSNVSVLDRTGTKYKVPMWGISTNGATAYAFIDKYIGQFGSKTYSMHTPEWILNSNEKVLLSFLAGLVDSDGSISLEKGIRYNTSSERMKDDVLLLANLLQADHTYWRTRKPRNFRGAEKGNARENYEIVLGSNELATKLLPYMANSAKVEKLSKRLEVVKTNKKVPLLLEMRDILNKYKKDPSFYKEGVQYVSYYSIKNTLKEISNLMTPSERMLSAHYLALMVKLTKVRGINTSVDYDEQFYDLTVEDNNNYFSGIRGLSVIHNTGFNLSRLRPAGAELSTGGVSTGPLSFAEIFNTASKTISAHSRRGATMMVMDISHPDIESFITIKRGDENKKLTQANISVAVSTAFMDAVKEDSNWDLIFDGKVYKTVKASYLWNLIMENSMKYAEPGVLFIDKINAENNLNYLHRLEATNPCGEQPLPAYTDEEGNKFYGSCNLGSVNFSKMVDNQFTDKASVNWDRLRENIQIGIRFLDNVIDRIELPLKAIENDLYNTRRVGLGFMGFADMLAKLGIIYGSTESKEFTKTLAHFFKIESYKYSIELAKEKGSFPFLDKYGVDKYITSSDFMKRMDTRIKEDIRKYGIRNALLTSIAPSGTISLTVGQNTSSGVEPIFSLQYDRKVRNGQNEEDTFTETVYDDAWLDFVELDETQSIEKPPAIFITAHEVNPYDKLDLISIWQENICTAISNTTNLDVDFTFDKYKDLYMYGYDKGLKGITTYWEGGALAPVLSRKKETKDVNRIAPKRPKSLPCEIHYTKAKGEEFMILVGILDAIPYELFVANTVDGFRDKEGTIVKNKKGHYSLLNANGENIIFDLSHGAEKEFGMMTRLLSLSLRHQSSSTPVQFIVDALSKDKDFVGFSRSVGRVLKKYIKEGENSLKAKTCPECGSEQLMFKEGCLSCTCGWSKCD